MSRRISQAVRKPFSPACLVCWQWPFSRAPLCTAAGCDIMVSYNSLQSTAGWFPGKLFSPTLFQHCTFNYFVALKTSKYLEIGNIDLVDEETSDGCNIFSKLIYQCETLQDTPAIFYVNLSYWLVANYCFNGKLKEMWN